MYRINVPEYLVYTKCLVTLLSFALAALSTILLKAQNLEDFRKLYHACTWPPS